MADEIRIKNVQAEVRDEAVPALIEAANAIMDAFVSDIHAGERSLALGGVLDGISLTRKCYANGENFFLTLWVDVCTPCGLGFSNINGQYRWGYGRYGGARVPTASEVEEAVSQMALLAEHYAVSQWAKKGKGTISRLKAIHRALT